MAGRDHRVTSRPIRVYGVTDALRDELAERPLRPIDVLAFLVGLVVVLLGLALVLATGSYPA